MISFYYYSVKCATNLSILTQNWFFLPEIIFLSTWNILSRIFFSLSLYTFVYLHDTKYKRGSGNCKNYNLLPLPDGQLRVEVCRRGLDPVDVSHEDGVLEFDVGFVLVLQLLRVDGSNPGTKLKLFIIIVIQMSWTFIWTSNICLI